MDERVPHRGLDNDLTQVRGVEESIMIRKLIAVAAVSGSLALGVAGVAGATTPSTPTAAPTAAQCARAEKLATRIQTLETKAAAWVPKAQAREAKATATGHTKLATRIGNRITRVQKREAKGTALLAKISAKCGTTPSAS
jgi:outer membrane murein-binding lipoprotein Lpp